YRTGATFADLRDSIAREGQREPIDLLDGRPHIIIDGHRRFRAIAELGLTSVKALVHRNLDEEEAHRMAFTKNVVRKNLSPLDRANAISLARRRGLKRVAITSAFGMSEKQLQRYEKLLEVPEALQRLVDDGRASMAHAFV